MENVEISARQGYENIEFALAKNFKLLNLDNVKLSGFDAPTIAVATEGKISIENTTSLSVKKVDEIEEYDC